MNTNKEISNAFNKIKALPKITPKQVSQARRDWLMTELAIHNLAKHLSVEASSKLLDSLYECPNWMQWDE